MLKKSAVLSAIAGLTLTSVAHAATITVNASHDTFSLSDGDCTLREALLVANYGGSSPDCGAGSSGYDEIEIDSAATNNHVTLSRTGTEDGSGAWNDLDVFSNVGIRSSDSDKVIMIDAGDMGDRVFEITDEGTLYLYNIGVTNGEATFGGNIAIHSGGVLGMLNGVVMNGSAANGGGGIFHFGPHADLTLSNVVFMSNNTDQGEDDVEYFVD